MMMMMMIVVINMLMDDDAQGWGIEVLSYPLTLQLMMIM